MKEQPELDATLVEECRARLVRELYRYIYDRVNIYDGVATKPESIQAHAEIALELRKAFPHYLKNNWVGFLTIAMESAK